MPSGQPESRNNSQEGLVTLPTKTEDAEHRVRGVAVLLTYFGDCSLALRQEFLAFVHGRLKLGLCCVGRLETSSHLVGVRFKTVGATRLDMYASRGMVESGSPEQQRIAQASAASCNEDGGLDQPW